MKEFYVTRSFGTTEMAFRRRIFYPECEDPVNNPTYHFSIMDSGWYYSSPLHAWKSILGLSFIHGS